MRFKLQLEVNKNVFGNRLPINYQYEQSAVIYRILARAVPPVKQNVKKV